MTDNGVVGDEKYKEYINETYSNTVRDVATRTASAMAVLGAINMDLSKLLGSTRDRDLMMAILYVDLRLIPLSTKFTAL
jgi:hypothetical protein